MKLFDIKRYFGRRSNEEIIREDSLGLRPDNPATTSFNRKLVIGLAGVFALIFTFSMFYGMSEPTPDKKNDEMAIKDKKIATTPQANSQLDKLPSSYENKNRNENIGTSSSLTGGNSSLRPPIQDNYTSPRQSTMNYTPPRQSYQSADYSSPPPIRGSQQEYDSVASGERPTAFTAVATAVDPVVTKEEQEVAEARKSPIRFNLK